MDKVDREDIYPFLDNYEEFDIEACVQKSKKTKKTFWYYLCCCFLKD